MSWDVKPLDEVVEHFIDYRGKTPNKTNQGIPLITAKIVKDGRLLEEELCDQGLSEQGTDCS